MSSIRSDEKLRGLYMGYLNDGIMDIFVGAIVLFAGFALFTDFVWMAAIYVAIFLPVVRAVKEKITYPRVRQEELKPTSSKQSRSLILGVLFGLLLVLFLGAIIFFLLQNGERNVFEGFPIILASIGLVALTLLGGFFFVGYQFQAPRWYGYAAVVVAAAGLAWLLGIGLPWVLIACGSVIAVSGSICLVRFLRSHPVLPDEERPLFNS